MSQGPDFHKIILLAVGCYLFSTMAQIQTSQAHPHGVMELAIRKLSHLDWLAMSSSGAEEDPNFAAMLAIQP